MPGTGCNDAAYEKKRQQKVKDIEARLIAKGLNPRGNGFARAFYKALRK